MLFINWGTHPIYFDLAHMGAEKSPEKIGSSLNSNTTMQLDASSREKFILENTGLVYYYAKIYRNWDNVDYEDVIQSGMEGLIRAVDSFEPERGVPFAGYAHFKIREAMDSFVRVDQHIVPLTPGKSQFISKIKKIEDLYYAYHGTKPTVEHIARCLNCTEASVERAQSYGLPLYAPMEGRSDEEEGYVSIVDILPNETSLNSDGEFAHVYVKLDEVLSRLKPRHAEIIRYRFGLYHPEDMRCGDQHTLAETSVVFNISKERTRQIEDVALATLKKELKNERHFLEEYT